MTKQNNNTTATDTGKMNAFADTNHYAAGKEGETIIENNQNEEKEDIDPEEEDAKITPDELDLLDEAGDETNDDDNLDEAQLDDKDEDGEALNEGSDLTGDDLDVPGAELDDDNEILGEEDEENNSYSKSDQDDK